MLDSDDPFWRSLTDLDAVSVTLGIDISPSGVSFSLRPAQDDGTYDITYKVEGNYLKSDIIRIIKEFDDRMCELSLETMILSVSLSIPGYKSGDSIAVYDWLGHGDIDFSMEDFQGMSFFSKRFELVRQIQAIGYGIMSIDEYMGLEDDFTPIWKPPALDYVPTLFPMYFSSESSVVIRVCTRLNAAFIVPIDSSDSYRVIPSEWALSIVQRSSPGELGYEQESAFLNYVQDQIRAPVTWQDICSEQGLYLCQRYLSYPEANIQDADHAEGPRKISEAAFALHFKYIIRFARMCAICFSSPSVFIFYEAVPGGREAILRQSAVLRDEFMHYTRNGQVASIPVFLQCSDKNIAATGVAYHAYLRLTRCDSDQNLEPYYVEI